jgi:hypothetical protein
VPSTVLVGSNDATTTQVFAVAVALADHPFVITTARAVAGATAIGDIELIGTDESGDGTVMAISGDLAFITMGPAVAMDGAVTLGTATPGEIVTVLSDEPTDVPYPLDGEIPELDPATVREGTPVVDDDGMLVALCTLVTDDNDRTVVALIPVEFPDALDADPSASTSSTSTTSTTSTTAPTSTTSTTSTTIAPDGKESATPVEPVEPIEPVREVLWPRVSAPGVSVNVGVAAPTG